ncbi:ATP-dependent nuclease [Limimaricola cinnabarinus]|uniref:ATP-dependent nuclease n=1 Tax=Limimaricola cinnabarinus TaxID=1125964 RepID=UPI0013A616FA|nr:AAA family ATPase [Limimaricola cinnabarinus]
MEDAEVLEAVRQVRDRLGVTSGSDREITLYLSFSERSNPSYRVFQNTKRPKGAEGTAYSRAERQLFNLVLSKISVHYIPSEKSVQQLYKDLVQPFLFDTAFEVVRPHLDQIERRLSEVSDEVNESLRCVGLEKYTTSFHVPSAARDFMRAVRFNIADDNKTEIFDKGMGVQSVALLSAFCWISRKEKEAGKTVLWLMEEPESYLHPELVGQSEGLMRRLSENSQVILTTHSLGFVPQDPSRVLGLDLKSGWTTSTKFRTYHEATAHIRRSLGVRFSDYYNLSRYNLLVEGETDRGYIDHVLKCLQEIPEYSERYSVVFSSDFSMQDFGGVRGVEGFLRSTFSFIRSERAVVALFDGDEAGQKAYRALQGYFGKKQVPFESNRNFVVVRDRFDIEGLLPDSWVARVHKDHPTWFESYSLDAQGLLLPFKVADSRKNSFLNVFKEMATSSNLDDWVERWLPVLDAIERALVAEHERLKA